MRGLKFKKFQVAFWQLSKKKWLPNNIDFFAKMGSFHQSKQSDNKRYTVEVKRGIFIENLTYFLFLKAVVNIPIQTLIIPP